MVEVRTGSLSVPGARLAYRQSGPPEAPAIVFLHGVGSSSHTWVEQLRHFGERWHCLAPDMRGYAASGVDDAASISMRRFALDVAELIQARCTGGRAVLCGLSMGGIVAQWCWREAPERVRGLLLSDTWANHPVAAAAQSERLAAIDGASMPELAEARMPAIYGPAAAPALVRRGVEVFAGLAKDAYRAASADLWTQDLREVAATVTVPTTVVVGEEDRLTPQALAAELVDLVPEAVLEVIPGAGHLANEEAPEAFDAALSRLLERAG